MVAVDAEVADEPPLPTYIARPDLTCANTKNKTQSQFNVQNLANTAWAFATVGQLDAALFAALAKEGKQRLG